MPADRTLASPLIAHGLFSYQIGGSERVGADLAIEFQRRGYRVICFAFYDTQGPLRDELEANGIECVDLNYESRRGIARRLTYQIEFHRFLRERNIDSLIVHHATALILCGIAARIARVRRVVMIEHAIHQLRERPNYRRSATRYCRFADHITGVDQKIVDYFRDEMDVPEHKLQYIPNGVRLRPPDAESRRATRRMLGLEDDQFVFLFAGRLQPVKDVGTLLKATAQLPATVRQRARILVAGDGPERSRLETLCRDLDLSIHVRFLGARRDVPILMSAADAFIMTSVTEGQPMALIEAMAAQLPCIATSVGGIPALLSDGAGILAQPSAPADVAAAMNRIVESEQLRAACVTAATSRIEAAHSLDRVVDRYLAALSLPPRAG